MEENILQLAEELGELGKSVDKKHELSGLVDVTEEQYIAAHLPRPEAKPLLTTSAPSKTRMIRTACFFLAFTVLALVLLFSAISSFSKSKKIDELAKDPGEEYEAWLDSFGTVSSFEELEDGWKTVEKAWKKRGVDVDWNFVVNVKDNMYASVIYADRFDQQLFYAIKNEKDHNSAGTTKLIFFILSLIPMAIFGINTKARYGEWRNATQKHEADLRENEARQKYNKTELPRLLAEREEKLPAVRAEYEDAIRSVREELAEAETEIAKRAHLLPPYYHENAVAIALILVCGRADTLKEAINIFEEDQRAAELADIERQRAADEERHRRAMEQEAQRAAEQAHQDALAQQRIMRDQMVAEQQARDRAEQAERRRQSQQASADARARSAAIQRCAKCANWNACGNLRGNPNCGSFRPK